MTKPIKHVSRIYGGIALSLVPTSAWTLTLNYINKRIQLIVAYICPLNSLRQDGQLFKDYSCTRFDFTIIGCKSVGCEADLRLYQIAYVKVFPVNRTVPFIRTYSQVKSGLMVFVHDILICVFGEPALGIIFFSKWWRGC